MIRRGGRKSLFSVFKVCRASMTAFTVSIAMDVPGMFSVTATVRKTARVSLRHDTSVEVLEMLPSKTQMLLFEERGGYDGAGADENIDLVIWIVSEQLEDAAAYLASCTKDRVC